MKPLQFLENGIAVIPVRFASKKPLIRWQRYQNRLPTERDFRRWFRPERPPCNAAVVCGWQGLTVLDFDEAESYLAWQAWAITQGDPARAVALGTYRVQSNRGLHVYLFIEDAPRCGRFTWGEFKGRGGLCLIPPSVHPSGHCYRALDESAPILRVSALEQVIPDPPVISTPLTEESAVLIFPTSGLWPLGLIGEIKARVSLLEFLPGARPHGSGTRWYHLRCPFHDDREPSFWVDTERGVCNCYAGCFDRPQDVIGLYARLHGLTNREAIKTLARRVGG